jgi:hypothetical protein
VIVIKLERVSEDKHDDVFEDDDDDLLEEPVPYTFEYYQDHYVDIVFEGHQNNNEPSGKRKRQDEGDTSDTGTEIQDGDNAKQLRELLKLEGVQEIVIRIQGCGAKDGSDFLTQLKIKEICKAVKDLIAKFGTRVTIQKERLKLDSDLPQLPQGIFDLTPYWNRSSAQARNNFRNGKASFEEVMQIQIEDWIKKS